ncbi:MAG: hypothetical protein ACON5B_15595 [Myxococcota bacterium]
MTHRWITWVGWFAMSCGGPSVDAVSLVHTSRFEGELEPCG